MNIYSLRMAYNKITAHTPFDRIYLVEHGNQGVFKQLFRYALVLPVGDQTKALITTAVKDTILVYKPHLRDDSAELLDKNAGAKWAETIFTPKDWVMAIPLLPKDAKLQTPRYLVAEKLYTVNRQKTHTTNAIFDDLAYLQTPKKQIRPVCIACPRFIAHQGGECSLGDKICAETLLLGPRYEAPVIQTAVTKEMVNDPVVYEVLEKHGLQNDEPNSL